MTTRVGINGFGRIGRAFTRLALDRADLEALAATDSGSGALMLVVSARGAGGFTAMLLGSEEKIMGSGRGGAYTYDSASSGVLKVSPGIAGCLKSR